MTGQEREYTAAIYCRLSEEDRNKPSCSEDSVSIANQKALLTEYCVERGWQIYGIYSDDDYTGSDRGRPAFNRLLRDAEAGKFGIILCKTQSRFTRELELVEKYINHLLPLWGVRFVSVVDNADTSVKGNKKARQINGLINEWYLEDMSENIKAVLTSRRRNGYFIGAFAPYGYKKDPERKGHLIIDGEAAANVRLIFSLYISGMGKTAVARELNLRHIPTPAEYKLSKGENYKNGSCPSARGSLWRYYMIDNILSNEVYIGNLVQNKAHSVSYKTKKVKPTPKSEWIRADNTHEPIIDRAIWDMARQISASRASPPRKAADDNIFSRRVFCSECGRALRTSKQKNRKYLRCSTKYISPADCTGVNINCERLKAAVLSEFNAMITEYADKDTLNDLVSAEKTEITAERRREIERLTAALNAGSGYLKSLYTDRVNGTISEEDYIELYSSFDSERRSFKERLAQLEADTEDDSGDTIITERYLSCGELTFEAVRVFIDKIVVHPKSPYSREDNIEIYWNF